MASIHRSCECSKWVEARIRTLPFTKVNMNLIKSILRNPRMSFVAILAGIIGSIYLSVQDASAADNTIVLRDYPIIISCYNQKTGEFIKPRNGSVQDGGCLIWPNMKNILLPSKKQMQEIKSVFGDRASIITAITLMNHESQFNPNAKGCHKGGCDYGLFQIRDVNWGKNMTTKEQMEWFKKRKEHQMNNERGTCSRTTAKGNHSEILRCIFSRHNGVLNFYAKYPSDRLKEHKFYTKYLGSNRIKF